jgi:DNA-binding protein H-NS
MAKTLAAIQEQIQKLQEQANVLKRKEAVGVIDKIKTAIDAYGLTPEDLFGTAPPVSKRGPKPKVASAPAAPAAPAKAGRKKTTTKNKSPSPAKYTDGTSTWSGHGKRPQWFKDAIESGKTAEDLAVKSS